MSEISSLYQAYLINLDSDTTNLSMNNQFKIFILLLFFGLSNFVKIFLLMQKTNNKKI